MKVLSKGWVAFFFGTPGTSIEKHKIVETSLSGGIDPTLGSRGQFGVKPVPILINHLECYIQTG